MRTDREHAEISDPPQHEAILTGVIALASLFSSCVEAFGLIHPTHKDHTERLLLARLGIQQARLLIWGDVVGVSSPPTSVTDRAVPRFPSPAYPDLTEPTFFGRRDPRLDETETRQYIEEALNAMVDRASHLTREQMMEQYGLKPPKRNMAGVEPALDNTRLEGFREKYELLQEVAESYAHINTRRNKSIITQSWMITDPAKFSGFIRLIQDKVDFLIGLMDIKERIDRAMRVDIRSLGWHVIDDRTRTMQDKLKLGLIHDACKDEYPEYETATQQALDQISREYRERAAPTFAAPRAGHATNGDHGKQKRQSLLGFLSKSFGKSRDGTSSTPEPGSEAPEPQRSLSDTGPAPPDDDDEEPIEPIRSKSLGYILEPTKAFSQDDLARTRLAQINTQDTVTTVRKPLPDSQALESGISRHDQYRGIGRVNTNELKQS